MSYSNRISVCLFRWRCCLDIVFSLTVRKVILYGKGDCGEKVEHQIWFK